MVIDGKKLSEKLLQNIKNIVDQKEIKPKLDIIVIGKTPAIESYLKSKAEAAKSAGVEIEVHEFDTDAMEDDVVKLQEKLNGDSKCSGYFIQFPIPNNFSRDKLTQIIAPAKDVDGLNPINLGKMYAGAPDWYFLPATVAGIIEILKNISSIEDMPFHKYLSGKNVVIINNSNIVGKPLAAYLTNKFATVTLCHALTDNIDYYTKNADIVVSAVGKSNLINVEMLNDKAVVIDAGIEKIDDKIKGDVDFETVKDKVKYITPVPGGVGPLTAAMLMSNVVKACLNMNQLKS